MQRLEVSCAVRHIYMYIYIYVVRRQRFNLSNLCITYRCRWPRAWPQYEVHYKNKTNFSIRSQIIYIFTIIVPSLVDLQMENNNFNIFICAFVGAIIVYVCICFGTLEIFGNFRYISCIILGKISRLATPWIEISLR